jgi:hypothetical protein
MPNHMPGEPVVVEAIADMLAEMTDLGPPQLVVRVYAKDLTNRFDELKRRRRDILFPLVAWHASHYTPMPKDSYVLSNSIRHCAVGVNIASTVSLELCMADKPVVNVAYHAEGAEPTATETDCARYYEFDHYRPVVESGAVTVARSEDQMRRALRTALTNPTADSDRRRALVRSMFGDTLDGYSALRVAECLSRLAGGTGTSRRMR